MQRLFLVLACVLTAGGCTSSDSDRQQLTGEVTFDGRAVPSGVIFFDPDASKGHDGRQGVAKIVDGKFDTRSSGKGVSGGHYIARITGFDSQPGAAPSTPLFHEYRVEVEITPESAEMKFDVPAGAAADVAPTPNLGI
ncbi:hypothetical protein [Aeoliella sp.]|uniref:hypothetical protein n=1 Tax=Aeoliella sp. TaxID=2795800 RepID=UPI003CCC385A